MKSLFFFVFLLGLVIQSRLTAQAREKTFPTPPTSSNRLFYIQRSTNTNTVIYEANLLAGQKLNPREPVKVYWIRYAENGQRQDLSTMQWQLAYGYRHAARSADPQRVDIHLNAFRKRPIRIALDDGRPVAFTSINGKNACLERIFVQVAAGSSLIPDVDYIELFGTDCISGQPVYERITL